MSELHADDETLSAHLDGAHEESQLRDHLEGCATCQARLAELRRARRALAAPVTPPPEWQRDAAISRALAVADDRAGARHRVGPWAGGIAAALLLVLGATVGLSLLSNDGHDTVASRASKPAARTLEAAGAATPPTTIAAEQLGDLGAIPDSAALRAVLQPAVALFRMNAKAAAGAPETTERAELQSGSGRVAPAPERRCLAAARALDPANVSPAAAGTATWQGTPAEVLVYAVGGRPGAARVYVLAQADCRVLEFQSYAP
jgi:hypothetical protein